MHKNVELKLHHIKKKHSKKITPAMDLHKLFWVCAWPHTQKKNDQSFTEMVRPTEIVDLSVVFF